jgi:predicted GNAT family N-acyltransferase
MTAAIPEGFQVEPADYRRDFDTLRAIRDQVFVREQQVPVEIELDALDPLCLHVIARTDEGAAIGTGRLAPDGRIGRMAVFVDWRTRGVGGVMLERLVELARGRGLLAVELHAQLKAQAFYARHGFEAHGENFFEAGIEHVHMRRHLHEATVPRPATTVELKVDSEHAAREICLQLLQQARYRVSLFCRDLDPMLLGTRSALEALRTLAARGRGAEVRLLLQDPASVPRNLHPWLPLLQRLTSAIQVRQVIEPIDRQNPIAVLLNDVGGYYHRPLAGRFEGTASLHAEGRCRQLQGEFDELWERAEPSRELRALSGL